MARRWTKAEEVEKRKELARLYVRENKTIGQIAAMLRLAEVTVYDRLVRLGIPILRSQKPGYNNKRTDIVLPRKRSEELAEFIGILLGDGHLTPTQVTVTLGKKDQYDSHIIRLIERIFSIKAKNITDHRGYRVIYFGSTQAVQWLLSMGLVFNKVKSQVGIPAWIFSKKKFMRAAVRGLIDTDGSVYRLRSGLTQMSFCNRSKPLLNSFRKMLLRLNFHPSRVSEKNVYLTRAEDLNRFFREIGFHNKKHTKRFLQFTRANKGASHSGNCS